MAHLSAFNRVYNTSLIYVVSDGAQSPTDELPSPLRVPSPPPSFSVPPAEESAAASFVAQAFPHARLSYALAGTLKYELPADEVRAGLGERALLRVSVTLTEPRST